MNDTPLAQLISWHAVRAVVRNGNYGVTMFFVTSGYLITSNANQPWPNFGAWISAASMYCASPDSLSLKMTIGDTADLVPQVQAGDLDIGLMTLPRSTVPS